MSFRNYVEFIFARTASNAGRAAQQSKWPAYITVWHKSCSCGLQEADSESSGHDDATRFRRVLTMQYAVIEVRENDNGNERFVIAYRDEQVLRGFLIGQSIIATGFPSADEAKKSSSFTIGVRRRRRLSNLLHLLSFCASRTSLRLARIMSGTSRLTTSR